MNQAKKEPRQMDAPQSTEIHFDLQQSIAEAAYYKAEKRGFISGFEEQDWAEAETEILSLYINDDTESKLHDKSEVFSPKHRNKLLENRAPMPDDCASQPAP
jgi:hypothetical protein